MKALYLALLVPIAALSSCSTGIDEYHYGYAPAYRTLPAEFARADIGGAPYWHHGGRFYKQDAERGFLLVQPPRGHEAVVATASGAPAPNADPVAAPKKSWLKSGGGSLKQAEHASHIGRSPIRRKRRIYSPE